MSTLSSARCANAASIASTLQLQAKSATSSAPGSLTPSGRTPSLANRGAWSSIDLRRAGLLETVRRGVVPIPPEGAETISEGKGGDLLPGGGCSWLSCRVKRAHDPGGIVGSDSRAGQDYEATPAETGCDGRMPQIAAGGSPVVRLNSVCGWGRRGALPAVADDGAVFAVGRDAVRGSDHQVPSCKKRRPVSHRQFASSLSSAASNATLGRPGTFASNRTIIGTRGAGPTRGSSSRPGLSRLMPARKRPATAVRTEVERPIPHPPSGRRAPLPSRRRRGVPERPGERAPCALPALPTAASGWPRSRSLGPRRARCRRGRPWWPVPCTRGRRSTSASSRGRSAGRSRSGCRSCRPGAAP